MRLGQTSLLYTVSRILGSALGFLATVYFARTLGESVLGQYALVLGLVTWLSIIGQVGLSKALVKRISEGEEIEEFVGAGVGIAVTAGIIGGVGVLLFETYVNNYVGVPAAKFVVFLFLVSLFTSLTNAVLQGEGLVHIYALISIGSQTAKSGLQILLAVAGLSLSALVYGEVIAGILTFLVSLWYLSLKPSLPRMRHFKSLFDFTKYSWIGNLSQRTYGSLDVLLLGVFVPSGLIGIYSVAWSISMFLDTFGNAIKTTLFPEMSQRSSEDEIEAVQNLTKEALTYAGFLAIPGLVGGLIIGDRLLRIYGEGFVVGMHVLGILIAATLVYTYNKQLLNTLNAIDRPDLAFRSNTVFILVNVVLNVSLIYEFGWVGAAVATLVSAGVGTIFSLRYVREQLEFDIPFLEISRQWFAAVVMGGVVYLLRQLAEATWLNAFNELFVLVLVGSGCATYVGTLLLVSDQFRTTVEDNLPFGLPIGRG